MEKPETIWTGEEQLVVGLDVGTTNCAASIVHLAPQQAPKVRIVARWPGSPNSSKIPSLILYTPEGRPVAFGAEALQEKYQDDLFEERLHLARWFKLHLHPSIMAVPPPYTDDVADEPKRGHMISGEAAEAAGSSFEVPPLPPLASGGCVPVEQCYSDMIRWLFDGTIAWWKETTTGSDVTWNKLGGSFKVVLAHPNGWGLREQTILKDACVHSGVMRSREEAERRIVMVTEAEASVHFSLLYSGMQEGWLSPGSCFAVVDAGGSTVDTTVYSVEAVHPKLQLREVRLSDCTQSGAIFVNRTAEQVIRRKLEGSTFATPEVIGAMLDIFDSKTKLTFDDVNATYIIKFGFSGDNSPAHEVVKGRLKLSGAEMEEAFSPCVNRIISSIKEQIKETNCSKILLVGGFGESPYLQRRIRDAFEKPGRRQVLTSDEPTKKAVAEGATLFYTQDTVSARATRYEFGLSTNRPYDPKHCGNRRIIVFQGSGKRFCHGGWTPIVPKGTVIAADSVHREKFWVHKKKGDSLGFSTALLTFDGVDGKAAYDGWCADPANKLLPGFAEAVTITGDLTALAAITPIKKGPGGEKYRELDFQVGVFFGGTSLKACVIYKDEKGSEVRGPASVMPSSVF